MCRVQKKHMLSLPPHNYSYDEFRDLLEKTIDEWANKNELSKKEGERELVILNWNSSHEKILQEQLREFAEKKDCS